MSVQRLFLILAAVSLSACAAPQSADGVELHELRKELQEQEADLIIPEQFQLFEDTLQAIGRDLTHAAGMFELPFDAFRPQEPLLLDYKIDWQASTGRKLLDEIHKIRQSLEKGRQHQLALVQADLLEIVSSANHPELRPLFVRTVIALDNTNSFLAPGKYQRALARLAELKSCYSSLRSRWIRYNGRRMTRTDFQREESEFQGRMNTLKPKGTYIVIDTALNRLYLKEDERVILEAAVSTGSYRTLVSSNRSWTFETPRGEFSIQRIIDDPIWRKPDWAFLEEGKPVPRAEWKRFEKGALGQYAFWFGGEYYIHGTPYTRLLGENVTHGCIRVGAEDLAQLAGMVSIGTKVYIF